MKVSWLWPESEVMGMSCFEFQFGGSTVYIISMYRFALVLRVLISSHFHCHFYKYSITYALRNWYCILWINKNGILCAVFMNQLNMQVRLPRPGLFLTVELHGLFVTCLSAWMKLKVEQVASAISTRNWIQLYWTVKFHCRFKCK